MTPEIEGLLQDLGNAALDAVGVDPQKLLLYCDVQEGFIMAEIYLRTDKSGPVSYLPVVDEMQALIFRFWDTWKATPGNKEFRYLMYVIENGDFTLDFIYPDQIPEDENIMKTRDDALMKYFGTSKISSWQGR